MSVSPMRPREGHGHAQPDRFSVSLFAFYKPVFYSKSEMAPAINCRYVSGGG